MTYFNYRHIRCTLADSITIHYRARKLGEVRVGSLEEDFINAYYIARR